MNRNIYRAVLTATVAAVAITSVANSQILGRVTVANWTNARGDDQHSGWQRVDLGAAGGISIADVKGAKTGYSSPDKQQGFGLQIERKFSNTSVNLASLSGGVTLSAGGLGENMGFIGGSGNRTFGIDMDTGHVSYVHVYSDPAPAGSVDCPGATLAAPARPSTVGITPAPTPPPPPAPAAAGRGAAAPAAGRGNRYGTFTSAPGAGLPKNRPAATPAPNGGDEVATGIATGAASTGGANTAPAAPGAFAGGAAAAGAAPAGAAAAGGAAAGGGRAGAAAAGGGRAGGAAAGAAAGGAAAGGGRAGGGAPAGGAAGAAGGGGRAGGAAGGAAAPLVQYGVAGALARGTGGGASAPSGNTYSVSNDGKLHTLTDWYGLDALEPTPFIPAGAQPTDLLAVDDVLYTSTINSCHGAPNGVWDVSVSQNLSRGQGTQTGNNGGPNLGQVSVWLTGGTASPSSPSFVGPVTAGGGGAGGRGGGGAGFVLNAAPAAGAAPAAPAAPAAGAAAAGAAAAGGGGRAGGAAAGGGRAGAAAGGGRAGAAAGGAAAAAPAAAGGAAAGAAAATDVAAAPAPVVASIALVATTAGTGQYANSVVALNVPRLNVRSVFTQAGGDFISSPVIFPMGDRTLAAVQGRDGHIVLLDTANLSAPLYSSPKATGLGGYKPAAMASWQDLSGQRWLLSTTATSVIAYKVTVNGSSASLTQGWALTGLKAPLAPVIVNGVVFVASSGEAPATAGGALADRIKASTPAVLYAVNGTTGEKLWDSGKSIVSFIPHTSGLWVSMGQVALGDYQNNFYTFGTNMERDPVRMRD